MKALTVTRWVTLVVWAAVAASAALWGLRLLGGGTPVPLHATTVAGTQELRGDPGVLLGRATPAAPAAVPVAPSRFKLIGVLVPRSERAAGEGLALIAIDDKPARAYRVGAVVDGDLVLQRVRVRSVDLGARGATQATMALEAPPLPLQASTGTLPTLTPTRPNFPPPQAMTLQPLPGLQRNDLEGEPDNPPDNPPADERQTRPGLSTQ